MKMCVFPRFSEELQTFSWFTAQEAQGRDGWEGPTTNC